MKTVYATWRFNTYADAAAAISELEDTGQSILSHGVGEEQWDGFDMEEGVISLKFVRISNGKPNHWDTYVDMTWTGEIDELDLKDDRHPRAEWWGSPFCFDEIATVDDKGKPAQGEAFDWGIN